MFKKIMCDICGEECKPNGKYEIIYKSLLRNTKEDICLNCMCKIKTLILDMKIQRIEEVTSNANDNTIY
jgi:hypothetical protein